MRHLLYVIPFIVPAVIVACSSAPPDTTGDATQNATQKNGTDPSTSSSSSSGASGSSSSSSGGSSSGGSTSSSSSSSSSGSSGTDPVAACAAKGDQCVPCCDAAFPKGSETFDNAYNACMCGAKGACQTQCAKSDCSADDNAPDSVTGDPCDVCETAAFAEDGTGTCDKPIADACNADADCVQYLKCWDACD